MLSLCKCVVLSHTKNIKKVLFKFLWSGGGRNLFTYLFYLDFLRPSSLSRFMAKLSLLWYNFPDFMIS